MSVDRTIELTPVLVGIRRGSRPMAGRWSTLTLGCGIFFTVLAMNLIGDGLNNALNPRLKRLQRQ